MRAKFNQGVATSKPETRLDRILRQHFGDDDVHRQIKVGLWRTDFYVKSIDTYVELDGEYWHGLDRPLAELEASMSRTDRKILGTHHSDQMQTQWFADNSLRLVRITDHEMLKLSDDEILFRVTC